MSRRVAPVRSIVLAVAATIAALAAMLSVGFGVASAHSGLAAASPGPGTVVGGEIDRIQIFYGDLITEFEGSVTLQATGEVLTATSEMVSDIEATITLEQPLSENGEYAVRHTITSIDGDVVEAAYLFSFDASAAPPQLVFVEEEDDSGTSPAVWIVLGVGSVVIALLAWRLIVAVRRRNAATPTHSA